MHYPLHLSFKLFAISQQVAVTDAAGALKLYVKQKAFRFREAVTVFADERQTQPLYSIEADRLLDFSAQYHVETADGRRLGVLRRQGMRSLWKAHYEGIRGGEVLFSMQEANPWTKVMDSLLGEIPVLGVLTGYLFHPAYVVTGPDGTELLRLEKQPAFLESRYTLERLTPLPAADEELAVLCCLMLLLLERSRG